MAKNIIFCADGTWNGPGKDDDGDSVVDATNVYKLFLGLAGMPRVDSLRDADEQEKEFKEAGRVTQVAKYIHGVGDSRNPICKLMGGAFGSGIIARIVRGYTFISREYEANDDIIITGFSRGAYTARALAGMIMSQGLLAKPLTVDKAQAYRWGAQAWYAYRKSSAGKRPGFFQQLAEATANLPAFLSREELKSSDLVAVPKIKAVGVWDTVGAMGLPRYIEDERADAFKFTDTKLSLRVESGFHAIALDEQRKDFTPTLWEPAANVTQVAFAGAHADIGGGYATKDNECGLSHIALEWMMQQLTAVGVRFDVPVFEPFKCDHKGTAHKPWLYSPFNTPGKAAARNLAGNGIKEHASIQLRMDAGPVVHEPREAPMPYAPLNRP